MLHKYPRCEGNLAETKVTSLIAKVGWVISLTFIPQFLLLGLFENLVLGEKERLSLQQEVISWLLKGSRVTNRSSLSVTEGVPGTSSAKNHGTPGKSG